MKYSEFNALQGIETLPSWEESLRKRQELLSGAPDVNCLVVVPSQSWPRRLRQSKLVVAAMCLAENPDCAACLKMLQNV